MSMAEVVDGLTAVTERLGELVEEENLVLKARRPHELARFQAEKERLAGNYERQLRTFEGCRKDIADVPAGSLAALKAATKHFQQALDEHRRLVQATKTVTERMLKAISREAEASRRPPDAYNRAGVLRPAFGNRVAAAPLALNQVV